MASLKRRRIPVQARAQATVDAILAAGEDLMERRGLDEVTTEEIAARAGVSIGTLYQYYPSKQAIFGDVVDRCWRRAFLSLSAEAAELRDRPLRDLIARMCEGLIAIPLARPRLSLTMMQHREALLELDTTRARQEFAAQLMYETLSARDDAHVEDLEWACRLLVQGAQATIRFARVDDPEAFENGRFAAHLTRIACRYFGVEEPVET